MEKMMGFVFVLLLIWICSTCKNAAGDEKAAWYRIELKPGEVLPFPQGARLRPLEEVILACPRAVTAEGDIIELVFLCDKRALISLNDEAELWLFKLQPGMNFALAKSCEVFVVAKDKRPRFFLLMLPNDDQHPTVAAKKPDET